MKKDVIYIDVEDDLTSIIEKIKKSDASIAALVPPRRLGVLQSVVNLKLLKRAADEADKKAVLITSDQSLVNLTAGLNIPVARNLQSRPEIMPEIKDESSEPDVIEGKTMTDNKDSEANSEPLPSSTPVTARPKSRANKKFKIPNINKFRKRLILGGLLLAALIAFGVWALIFAPQATVTIQAKADKIDTNLAVKIEEGAAGTNPSEPIIKAEKREDTQNLSEKFTATGKKEVGEKAKGSITIRNCDYSDGFTLAAGAQFRADGLTFVSTKSVTVPKFTGSASSCSTSGSNAGTAKVSVQASEIGKEYNLKRQQYSIPGVSGKVDAIGTDMTGGSKKEVTVVTTEDVNKARQKIEDQNHDTIKSELATQFGENIRAIEDTFAVNFSEEAVSPNVDEEATEATLTITVVYSMLGVKNDDISQVLNKNLEADIDDSTQQKIYDNGYDNLQINISEKTSASEAIADFKTAGFIGPNIDTDKLETEIVGMRYGQIEALIASVPGVEDVNIKFSPFWVNKAPKAEKTTVKLEVANEE